MRLLAIVSTTLLAFNSLAAEKVVGNAVPPSAQVIVAAAGSLVTLTGEHNTRWQLASESVPLGFWPDGPECRIAAVGGRWLILAVTDKEVKRFVVDYSGKAPDPMPTPPGPVPPAPIDSLKDKLTAAIEKDAAAKADVLKLASHYTAAAAQVKLPTVATAGQLIDAMKAVNPVNGKLIETQRVIAAELLALLKDLKAPLTDVNRDATAKLFTAAATALNPKGE